MISPIYIYYFSLGGVIGGDVCPLPCNVMLKKVNALILIGNRHFAVVMSITKALQAVSIITVITRITNITKLVERMKNTQKSKHHGNIFPRLETVEF